MSGDKGAEEQTGIGGEQRHLRHIPEYAFFVQEGETETKAADGRSPEVADRDKRRDQRNQSRIFFLE